MVEDFGTLTVTLAPVGTLRFAVLAILKNVAEFLPLRVIAFAVDGETALTGAEGTLVTGIDGLVVLGIVGLSGSGVAGPSGSGVEGSSGSGLDGLSASEQTMFAWTAILHFDKLVYNRRFVVPLETFVRTFELADPVIAVATAAEDADGNKPFTTAA
jgi:hypothetical protein